MPENSLKDLVVRILSNHWPLTSKQLHSALVKQHAFSGTYQAVHKTLQKLVEENIIEKESNGFKLSPDWLNKQLNFFETAKTAYATGNQHTNELWEKDVLNASFKTPNELGRFFIQSWFKYPTLNLPSVCVWQKIYSLIGLNDKEMLSVREMLPKLNYFIVCPSHTKIDELFSNAFSEMNIQFKLGVKEAKGDAFDSIVQGHHVMRAYWPFERRKRYKKIFEESDPKKFDLNELLRLMHDASLPPLLVTITRNEALAKQIREDVLKHFK